VEAKDSHNSKWQKNEKYVRNIFIKPIIHLKIHIHMLV
jgi:hypothetical protein